MKWTSLFVTIAFLVGLGTGFFARGAGFGTYLRIGAPAADLAAIQKLHQADVEATRRQDPQGLLDLWTEDAVRFNPPNLLKSASRPLLLEMPRSMPSTRA